MTPVDAATAGDPNFPFGLVGLPELSLIRVTGRDRTPFVNNFCTNDLLKRRPGQGCEAFVTDAKAHILAHIAVCIQEDALLVTSLARQADELIGHWDRYCITEDVQFTDLSTSSAGFALCGPGSSTVLSRWGLQLPAEPWSHGEADMQPIPLLAVRLPFSETDAYLAITTADSSSVLLQAAGSAGIPEATGSLFDELRIAAGFPEYGRDISRDNLPQEVNRNDLAISFTKGCYLGQETVARIDALGHVNRLLVPLIFASTSSPSTGESLQDDSSGSSVGSIGSAAWSPRRQAYLAMGMVRRSHAQPGTRLRCSCGLGEVLLARQAR